MKLRRNVAEIMAIVVGTAATVVVALSLFDAVSQAGYASPTAFVFVVLAVVIVDPPLTVALLLVFSRLLFVKLTLSELLLSVPRGEQPFVQVMAFFQGLALTFASEIYFPDLRKHFWARMLVWALLTGAAPLFLSQTYRRLIATTRKHG